MRYGTAGYTYSILVISQQSDPCHLRRWLMMAAAVPTVAAGHRSSAIHAHKGRICSSHTRGTLPMPFQLASNCYGSGRSSRRRTC